MLEMEEAWTTEIKHHHDQGRVVVANQISLWYSEDEMVALGYDTQTFVARKATGEECHGRARDPGSRVATFVHPAWQKILIDRLKFYGRVGFDAVRFDLSGVVPSSAFFDHNDVCKTLWDEYLAKRGLEVVPLPRQTRSYDLQDPILYEHMMFRFENWIEGCRHIFTEVNKAYPDMVFSQNIAVGDRHSRRGSGAGFSIYSSVVGADVFTGDIHLEQAGHTVAPYMGCSFKLGEMIARLGVTRRPIHGIHKELNDEDDAPLPRTLRQHYVSQLEAFAYGAAQQRWQLNRAGLGRDETAAASAFVTQKCRHLYANTTSREEVRLLYSYVSHWLTDRHPSLWFGQLLNDLGVPFGYSLAEKTSFEELSQFKVVVCPDLAYMSDELHNVLEKLVQAGVRVVVTGASGRFVERGVPREESFLFQQAESGPLFVFPGVPEEEHWLHNDYDNPEYGDRKPEILPEPPYDKLKEVFRGVLSTRFERELTTVVNVRQVGDTVMFHVLNYNFGPTNDAVIPDDVGVHLKTGGKKVKSVVGHDPGQESLTVSHEVTDRTVVIRFTVRGYAVIEVVLE